MSTHKESGTFEKNGMSPEAVEEFEKRLPKMEEGDYMIGGSLREPFKPFVYSGLVSEFPVNGETVFIVTERGEKASKGYGELEELVEKDPAIERAEAFKVLDAQTESENQAVITEELLSRHRAKRENKVKNNEEDDWLRYHQFGTEMLDHWEQAYHRVATAEEEALTEYAEILGTQIETLKGDLARLARHQEESHIEDMRESLYQLEDLTEQI